MATVRYKASARADVEAAAVWYESQGPGLGTQFLRSVADAAERVAHEPELYAMLRPPVRRAVMRRFPYALFYLFEAGEVVVLACMHHRRAPRRWPVV